MTEEIPSRRGQWTSAPDAAGLLALTDDELLFHVEALPPDHQEDALLLQVVRSGRHFFVRQEAAKRLRDKAPLRDHSEDRHLGQILVRDMTRAEDIAYLERLIADTRHLEVRKAAEAQLRLLRTRGDAAGA